MVTAEANAGLAKTLLGTTTTSCRRYVVTAETNAGLAKMLPSVCDEIRTLVGEHPVTIVFDRGGGAPSYSSS